MRCWHGISRVNNKQLEDMVEGVRHGMPVKYVELSLLLGQGRVLFHQLFQEAKDRGPVRAWTLFHLKVPWDAQEHPELALNLPSSNIM